jgi:hypothetical protein
MEKELFAEDVAPDGAGKLFGAGFYKDAAPTALGEGGLARHLSRRSWTKAEVIRRRKRSTGEKGWVRSGKNCK